MTGRPVSSDADRPRTAVVAGGTGALGRAVVASLLARGERVLVPWIVAAEADGLRQACEEAAAADRLRLVHCDVTDDGALGAALAEARDAWGPLWLACSVAGGWAGGAPVEDDDDRVWQEMLHANLRTAVSVARCGLRAMGEAGGRVVLVGSRTALQPAAGQAAYAAAKAAVHALVATLAEELRGSGRTANAVVPKVIDTPANRRAMPAADHARWVPPEAIADVIAWLGSAASWPVSGAVIPVYGDA